MRETCPICIEDTPPSRRFACPSCEYVTCKACTQRYITSVSDDPNCMNCHRLFDREVLCKGLSQSFVNHQLKAHREHVLFDREKAMMPATQPYVTQELQRRENTALYQRLLAEKRVLRDRLWVLERSINDVHAQLTPPLAVDRRTFVHRCAHEGCKGFLNQVWRCGTCNRYTCSECNAPLGDQRQEGHVCDPNDVATMTAIKHDSRKCPGCATFIFKVSGCDQMWCTSCHTAFCWRTGRVINSNIHNPHFYEFQRNHLGGALGRDPNDIPCGAMPSFRELMRACRAFNMDATTTAWFGNFHRLLLHIDQEERPRYDVPAIDEQGNVDLRVLFMLDELDEAGFREKLQQREKRNQKKRDIALVLQMMCNTLMDFFRAMVLLPAAPTSVARALAYRQDMVALVDYGNQALLQVSERFKCVVPCVEMDHFRVVSTKR